MQSAHRCAKIMIYAQDANSPDAEPLPINTAWKALQRVFRHLADIEQVVIRPLNGVNKTYLRTPRTRGNLR